MICRRTRRRERRTVQQTSRKTEPTRQKTEDRESVQRKRSRETKPAAALALEAILAGSWDQLPAEGVLSLSHTLGNGALLDLFSMRTTGPEAQTHPMPQGPCLTAPMRADGGEPLLADTPDFGALTPLGNTAPVEW